jgi:tRNA A37 threonylcarbamoyladenosine modification protein TsaB
MKILIVDAARDKIFFKIITDKESYTSDYFNSRENFDKFNVLLSSFLMNNNIKIKDIDVAFINQGPGNYSSIRISIATIKALKLVNSFDLYGFKTEDVINENYDKIIELFKKGDLIKDLIKIQYLN